MKYIQAIIDQIKQWRRYRVAIEFVMTMVALGKIVTLMLKRLPDDRKVKELVQLKTAINDAHRTKSTHMIKNYMMRKLK